MPKLTPNNNNYINIPLSQIIETGNIRFEYDEEKIQELAKSILKNGLLNPLTVKRLDTTDEFGNAQFELICGHRRKRALEYLCTQGNDYNNVTVYIRQGSKARMQLIENIQRENLKPQETEEALKELLKNGYTKTQISEELSKSLSWVSDVLAGNKVRENAESAGIDTSKLTSKTLSQFRKLPTEQIPSAVEELKQQGGTFKTATKIKNKQNKTTNSPMQIDVNVMYDMIKNYQNQMLSSTFKNDKVASDLTEKICADILALIDAYQQGK